MFTTQIIYDCRMVMVKKITCLQMNDIICSLVYSHWASVNKVPTDAKTVIKLLLMLLWSNAQLLVKEVAGIHYRMYWRALWESVYWQSLQWLLTHQCTHFVMIVHIWNVAHLYCYMSVGCRRCICGSTSLLPCMPLWAFLWRNDQEIWSHCKLLCHCCGYTSQLHCR